MDFVNREITDKDLCNYLKDNTLRKTSKIALFPTENIFVQEDGLNLGSKFEYYLTNLRMLEASDKDYFSMKQKTAIPVTGIAV